ncbi:MAG: hypothetical protein J6P32_00005, partial [Stomatobaculum sp.]|nr:hypothetical protein [Stomatobaculum sp.]
EERKLKLPDGETNAGMIYGIWTREDGYLYYDIYPDERPDEHESESAKHKKLDLSECTPITIPRFHLDKDWAELLTSEDGITITALPEDGETEIPDGLLKWEITDGEGFIQLTPSADMKSAVVKAIDAGDTGASAAIRVSTLAQKKTCSFSIYDPVESLSLYYYDSEYNEIAVTDGISMEMNSVEPLTLELGLNVAPDSANSWGGFLELQ